MGNMSWFLAIAVCTGITAVTHADEFNNNTVRIQTKDKAGRETKVVVKKTEYPANYLYKEGFWGRDPGWGPPKFLISDFEVWCSGTKLEIPLSAFADLPDPARVFCYANVDQKNFDILIIGGQETSAYHAVLSFKNGQIIKRKVVGHENPTECWAETNYSWVPNDNR